MSLSFLPTLLGVHLLALMTPGPDFVFVSRTALASSRRAGALAAVGVVLGVVVWAGAALVGLHVLLEKNPWLSSAIKVGGGSYLVYLGLLMLRAAWAHSKKPAQVLAGAEHEPEKREAAVREASQSEASALRVGFLTNLANPKAAIYFASIFATFIGPAMPAASKALVLALVSLESLLWFLAVAALFSLPAFRRLHSRAQGVIDGLAGAAFVLLGARLVASPWL